jgi:putative oxidoreductase
MKINALVSWIDSVLAGVARALHSPLLLVVRLFWGWQFFQTGWGKLMNLEKTTAFFASLDLPLPKLNAIAAGSVEAFGGLLLLVGFKTRWVTPALIFTMLVAYLTADLDAVKAIWSDPDKFTGAAPFLFLSASVLVFVFGPGKFSVDGWREPRN